MRELALHVLDILENALTAGATRVTLTVHEDTAADMLTISVQDNGCGMDESTVRRVLDPFYTTRTTRHVGLGLPLLAAAAERCNGGVRIESQMGHGTTVTATFQHSHLDRAPLGDMGQSLLAFLLAPRPIDLAYVHRVDVREFAFDTAELRSELGDVPLSHPIVRDWLGAFIAEGETELSHTY
ncbi:MAG: ATP-binding protein [Chloroflexi bacterium]|nr:ATP-binding protein [Chloroflexota bacterium]MBU1747621.1 ATP-binding protein [Chloroflexota bacterium]MBU1878375.1 ATP-binding protein [Chloroflexota bacterium]